MCSAAMAYGPDGRGRRDEFSVLPSIPTSRLERCIDDLDFLHFDFLSSRSHYGNVIQESSLPRHLTVRHVIRKPSISPLAAHLPTSSVGSNQRRAAILRHARSRQYQGQGGHQKRPCPSGAGGKATPSSVSSAGSRSTCSPEDLGSQGEGGEAEDEAEDEEVDDVAGGDALEAEEAVDLLRGGGEDMVPALEEEGDLDEDMESDQGKPVHPSLIHSLFPHVPPVIRFVKEGDRVKKLDPEHRKLLKWRLSSITPVVIRRAIHRSGFTISTSNRPNQKLADTETHDWIGYFGHHMKATCFRTVRDYQKVNHLPGSFQVGRKDRLWVNLSRMKTLFGKREFNFVPHTYCLPNDMKRFRRVWDEGGPKQKWIIKPPAGARGNGIRVIYKWCQLPKKRPVVVQKYLARPYLINGSKFDLRLYIHVTSFDPLRIYLCREGLVRFATIEYSSTFRNLSNKFMHLTNYSVNKKNVAYKACSATDDKIDTAEKEKHKWTLGALWSYLDERGEDTQLLWTRIKDLVVKTMCSADGYINSLVKMHCRRRACVHELFGFDVLLDEKLKPWLLEVNISPSLHSNSPLDVKVKSGMAASMLCLAGFQIPDPTDIHPTSASVATGDGASSSSSSQAPSSTCAPPDDFTADKRLWDPPHTSDERAKHAFYTQRATQSQVQQTILDVLTPDDLRILVESVDESYRCGLFDRVFPLPGPEGARYLRFLTQPRYYNLLLHSFLTRFHKESSRGEALLHHLCSKRVHLQSTSQLAHKWTPPSGSTLTAASLSSALNSLTPSVTPTPTSTQPPSPAASPTKHKASSPGKRSSVTPTASFTAPSSPFKPSVGEGATSRSPAAAYLSTGHDWLPSGSYFSNGHRNHQPLPPAATNLMQYRLPNEGSPNSLRRRHDDVTSNNAPESREEPSSACPVSETLIR